MKKTFVDTNVFSRIVTSQYDVNVTVGDKSYTIIVTDNIDCGIDYEVIDSDAPQEVFAVADTMLEYGMDDFMDALYDVNEGSADFAKLTESLTC